MLSFKGARFDEADLSGAILDGTFDTCSFKKAVCREAMFEDGNVTACDFTKADLTRS